MTTVTREFHFDRHDEEAKTRQLLEQEWLVTNGLGGYASGTVCGALTRRYHGLLIAAYPSPLGRIVVLNRLTEAIRFADGSMVRFGGDQKEEGLDFHGMEYLTGFRLEDGLPVWRYDINGTVIEKQLVMVHRQNTMHLIYRLLSGEKMVRLKLQPYLQFRHHDASVDSVADEPYMFTAVQNRYQISSGTNSPQLRLVINGGRGNFTLEEKHSTDIFYNEESARGYESLGTLWTAGYFAVDLGIGHDAALTASTETWETIAALPPAASLEMERERRRLLLAAADPRARQGLPAELVLATDQFIITPAGRHKESVRAHAMGDEVCTVIAGYHWFTDWGRDTMISLEGLTLATGRHTEAGWILRTFAHYVKNGLIPNLFPEGHSEGLYHTADASLWFFHALNRYLEYTNDRATLHMIMPQMREIIDRHLSGTSFGIGVDPSDGLLKQGAEGYQLTWMDAKVGDWVVTPRRGKAVELNALWYNALRLMQQWTEQLGDEQYSRQLGGYADQTYRSFNQRFWFADGGYLYDVVDGELGDDSACRPNQLFAISLPYPVLERDRWPNVLDTVRQRLLTPVGLRTLAPGHPDYKPTYHGDLRARDAAYHQGTVWPWLIGTFIDSWMKLYPDQVGAARGFLEGLVQQLNQQCIGSISEIFDAEQPYSPRGCIAQAWSVAEMLRCWLKTAQ
ncbi:amylo-alpha-1,6-glucosidase [Geomonas anaerohicana]|uniref:Glycogen debranching enzyme family protein n=1 Tax=Geomonas anaerohicana TaxID=2798583 RepID=A0ABS0YBU0_9BACT|nr:amylo-alpha-1,6-glucosidase [Geomonas anaerohicana]MBJ6749752.1 glycogen debranching enzyme family protein [Geomonas anaerohicana]